MRLGIVRGQVVLNPRIESFAGKRLVVLEPVTMENLRPGMEPAAANRWWPSMS